MSSAEKIKRLFAKSDITVNSKVDDRIIGNALTAFDKSEKTQSVSAEPNIWRIIMKSRITKFGSAAAIIFCGLGLLVFFGNGETLYAQVIKAIENARTIHVVTKSLVNGQWQKNTEVWYEQGKGIRKTSWRNGERTYIRIDNGRYMWKYRAGDDFAKRSKSIDPIGSARQKLVNVDPFEKGGIREPSKDKVVDGIRFLAYAYVWSNPENTYRMLSWLDEAKHVRAWEKIHLLDSGQWETYRIGEVEYNVELSPKVFLPDFGEDIEIVEVDTKLKEYFGLDDALFSKEELGLIFAVHELVRCEGDLIFAISSIRPTDSWRKKVTSNHPRSENYGAFSFRARFYHRLNLADIYHAGLLVKWTLFSPEGFGPKRPEECEFEVYMHTQGASERKRSELGLPTRKWFKPIAVLPLPKESIALAEVMDKVYSTTNELEPFVASTRLTLKSVPCTDEEMEEYIKQYPVGEEGVETRKWRAGDRSKSARLHLGQSSNPSEISKEDWVKDRMDERQVIENNYKQFLQEVKKREKGSR